MNGAAFLVRVRNDAGALERVLGTLRRKALGVERLSFFPGPGGAQEILVRTSGADPSRVKAELERLVDVGEVLGLGRAESLETRELAVARVPPGSGPFLVGPGRLLSQDPEGDLLEITGAPEEVDRALAEWASRDVLTGFHRTGEVPTPPGQSIRGRGENG